MSDRNVYRRADGTWVNKRVDSDRASSLHSTQADAYAAAREMSERAGGGEVTVYGLNGQFREKNTIAPASDPFPPHG
jgi:uncharacterized protein YdaU (DUF1376 family)